ncbi:MAG: DUF4363 family protein [Bacillota bacterium]|nr:DUF4363 family protein [Bacillota bacterium]
MKNYSITYWLLSITLAFFIGYFLIQRFAVLSNQPVVTRLNDIIQYAQQDNWSKARNSADEVIKIWEKDKYFIMLNYAEADYSIFIDSLARIQGAIRTRDKTETVIQVLSTIKLWENFIKVIPAP